MGASRPAVDSFRHAWEPSGRLCEKTSRFEMAKRDRTVTAPSPRRSRLSVRERELRRRAAWSGAATTRRRAAAAATTRCVAVERACRSGGSGPCECTVVISRVIDVSQFRAARHRGPVHQAMAHVPGASAVSSCMERRSSQASCATPHTRQRQCPWQRFAGRRVPRCPGHSSREGLLQHWACPPNYIVGRAPPHPTDVS